MQKLSVSDIHPKDKLEEVLAHFDAQAKQERIVAVDVPCLRKDGTVIYCDISATVVKKFVMGRDCLLGFFRDTTDLMKTAGQIEEKKATIDSIFRAAPVGIGLISNRVFKWTNSRIFEITGYSNDELTGQSSRIFYQTEEEFLRVGEVKYGQIIKKGIGIVETLWQCKDGSLKNILLSSAFIDVDKQEKGAIFTALDITKLKQTEKVLGISESKFKSLVEMIPDLIWEIDIDGKYTYVSPKVMDILGYDVKDILGKTIFDIMPEGEAERIKNIFVQTVKKQKSFYSLENIVLHKKGHKVILETSGSPFFDQQGKVLGYRGLDRDISKRVKD